MGKSSRQGQALLEIIVFVLLCTTLVMLIETYERDVHRNQKKYRWETSRD